MAKLLAVLCLACCLAAGGSSNEGRVGRGGGGGRPGEDSASAAGDMDGFLGGLSREDRLKDPLVQRIKVSREDEEQCSRDMDCDDWCKERSREGCICRCKGFLEDAVYGCKAENMVCQEPPYPFWGGSFNMTAKTFKSKCKKHPIMLVAFTARSCRHCVDFEPAYKWATPQLDELGIPLARVDVDVEKDFSRDMGISTMPAVKVVENCKDKGLYKGYHSPSAFVSYANKLLANTVTTLTSVEEVQDFSIKHNVSVISFFSKADGYEDEEEEFREAAESLRFSNNVYFATVKAKAISSHFEGEKWFKKAPAIVVFRNFDLHDRDLDSVVVTELADMSVQEWISKRTVRLVDEVTGTNFAYYESLRIPMLLLFVNKTADNSAVLKDFKAVARFYQGKVSFGYLDGRLHATRKIALGLTDDLLPAMAFNTLTGALYPFPSWKKLDQRNIKEHVEGFLTGRLQPSQASATDEEVKAAQQQAEKDGAVGLIEITRKNFNQICMDEFFDVMVLFYSASAQVTRDFWPYWKKTVERFRALKIDTLKIGRYDLSRNQLPDSLELDSLPSIVMFPARDKSPPHKMFHGKAKVRPIMLWAQEVASIKFEFPNDTPHLDDEQRKAYLVQIKERDERVGAERAKKKAERIAKLKEEEDNQKAAGSQSPQTDKLTGHDEL